MHVHKEPFRFCMFPDTTQATDESRQSRAHSFFE